MPDIIIVGDDPCYNVEKVVMASGIRAEIIETDQQRGPGNARNLGIKNSVNNIIAFTDDDCIVSRNWVKIMRIYMTDCSKKVAGVGGPIFPYDRSIMGYYFVYHQILDPFYRNGKVLFLVTANAAFRRKTLEEVGGFDSDFNRPGGEDTGLSMKLLAAGYQLNFTDQAIVYHDFSDKRGPLSYIKFCQKFYYYKYGCALVSSKYWKKIQTKL